MFVAELRCGRKGSLVLWCQGMAPTTQQWKQQEAAIASPMSDIVIRVGNAHSTISYVYIYIYIEDICMILQIIGHCLLNILHHLFSLPYFHLCEMRELFSGDISLNWARWLPPFHRKVSTTQSNCPTTNLHHFFDLHSSKYPGDISSFVQGRAQPQLSLVVYPIVFHTFSTSQVVIPGFLNQQRSTVRQVVFY